SQRHHSASISYGINLPLQLMHLWAKMLHHAPSFWNMNSNGVISVSRSSGANAIPNFLSASLCRLCTVDLSQLRISAICPRDRKSTRLNSSHVKISYAVFCL